MTTDILKSELAQNLIRRLIDARANPGSVVEIEEYEEDIADLLERMEQMGYDIEKHLQK